MMISLWSRIPFSGRGDDEGEHEPLARFYGSSSSLDGATNFSAAPGMGERSHARSEFRSPRRTSRSKASQSPPLSSLRGKMLSSSSSGNNRNRSLSAEGKPGSSDGRRSPSAGMHEGMPRTGQRSSGRSEENKVRCIKILVGRRGETLEPLQTHHGTAVWEAGASCGRRVKGMKIALGEP